MVYGGAYKIRITPPIGVPLDGYLLRSSPSLGIHDDLHARALVLKTKEEYIAIVSLDLLYVTKSIVDRARGIISKFTDIPGDSVFVVATHTHSGPSILGIHSCEYHLMINEYVQALPGYIASAVIQASKDLKEVKIGFGKGQISEWIVNRRNPLKGSVDKDLIVVRVEDTSENLVAALINFTCHAVVLGHNNLFISADYPGQVCKAIEAVEGGIALFLNGACGDINPLTPGTLLKRVYNRTMGTFADMRKMGFSIGGEALRVLNSLKTFEEVKISSIRKEIILPLQRIPEVKREEIEELREKHKKLLEEGRKDEAKDIQLKIHMLEWLKKIRTLHPGSKIKTEMQAIRIGDVIIVGIPGEPLVEIGLRIKEKSQAPITMVVGYANDVIGYIPTREAFKEGGYETQPPACIVDPKAEEIIINTAMEFIENLLSA